MQEYNNPMYEDHFPEDKLDYSQEIDKSLFRTSDMALGSYLLMHNIELAGLENAEQNTPRINFVFNINAHDPKLAELILLWTNNEDVLQLKRILHASKVMKRQIRFFMEWRNEQSTMGRGFYGNG